MNLIEALRTNKPLRRPIPKFIGPVNFIKGDGRWIDPNMIWSQFLSPGSDYQSYFGNPSWWLSKEDVLADDWEVRHDLSDGTV